jgi:hypothetical protein
MSKWTAFQFQRQRPPGTASGFRPKTIYGVLPWITGQQRSSATTLRVVNSDPVQQRFAYIGRFGDAASHMEGEASRGARRLLWPKLGTEPASRGGK